MSKLRLHVLTWAALAALALSVQTAKGQTLKKLADLNNRVFEGNCIGGSSNPYDNAIQIKDDDDRTIHTCGSFPNAGCA